MSFIVKNSLLVILILMSAVASITARTLIDLPIFIVSVLALYILPGIAIQKAIHQLDYSNYNRLLFSSFAVGYTSSLFIYILFLMLGIHHYVMIAHFMMFAFSLHYLRNDYSSIKRLSGVDRRFLSLVLVSCYIVVFLCFQLKNLSPEVVSFQTYDEDMMCWFRNTVAAKVSYPLPDLSVFGKDCYYHYFSSLGLANISIVTGIEVFDLCFTYSYIINVFLIVGAVYLICSLFIHSKYYLYWAIILILFTTSYSSITFTSYPYHLYFGPFGFAEGFAFSLFSYYFYVKTEQEQFAFLPSLLSLMVFMVAIGSKAPIAMVVMFGILTQIIINGCMDRNNEKKTFLIMCIAYVFCFVLVSCVFVHDLNPDFIPGSGRNLSLSVRTIFASGFFRPLLIYLYNNCIWLLPFYFVLALILYIFINSFVTMSWVILCIRYHKKIIWSNDKYGILTIFIVGYLLFLFLYHIGFSQVYFYYISIPFGLLFFLSLIDNNNIIPVGWGKKTLVISSALGCGLFLYSVFSFIEKNDCFYFHHKESISGNSINVREMEALRWVRDHVDNTAVVLSNKYTTDDGNLSFLVSTFAERQTFWEGFKYGVSEKDPVYKTRQSLLKRYFMPEGDKSIELKENGITHVVFFKNIGEKLLDRNVLFENEAVIIYAL